MLFLLHVQLRKSASSYMAVVVFLYGSSLGLTSVIAVYVGEYKRVVNGEKLGWLCLPCSAFLRTFP